VVLGQEALEPVDRGPEVGVIVPGTVQARDLPGQRPPHLIVHALPPLTNPDDGF
jgi:hypothetical protein